MERNFPDFDLGASQLSSEEEDLNTLRMLTRQQIDEYRAETDRMNKVLHGLGLGAVANPSLDEEPLESLIETLTDVAVQLNVSEPTEAALDLALSHLRLKVSKLPVENFRVMQKVEKDKNETIESLRDLSLSEAALRRAEAEAPSQLIFIQKIPQKIKFLDDKAKEYAKQSDYHSSSLKMSRYRKELSHEAIIELKKTLDHAREEELKPLKARLESFRGLPPNNLLALAKLAEAEKELEDLRATVRNSITSVHV